MGPNLTMGRATADQAMNATVRIERDPEGFHDDTIDPDTLALIPDRTTRVYDGQASVHPTTQLSNQARDEGGQQTYRDNYNLRLPIDAPTIKLGDTVTITATDDDLLADMAFTITEVLGSAQAVTRRCRMVRRQRGPAT